MKAVIQAGERGTRLMPIGAKPVLELLVLAKNVPTHVFEHQGLWLDTARVEDFPKVQDIRWEEYAPSLMVVGA